MNGRSQRSEVRGQIGSAVFFVLACSVVGVVLAESPAPQADLLTSAIDPFHEGQERARFLKAAGVDSELSEAEFEADKESKKGFARAFDVWPVLMRFDENRDNQLNWFEVTSYRRRAHVALLAKHDANRDGRLRASERRDASVALADGRLLVYLQEVDRNTRDNGEGPPSLQIAKSRPPSREERDSEIAARLRELDADGDGGISTRDMEATKEMRRKWWADQHERNRAALLKQYDANGDGQVDRDESKKWVDERARTFSQRFDRDGDGLLNDNEKTAWEGSEDRRFIRSLAQFDLDGDGLHNFDEAEARRIHIREQSMARENAFLRWLQDPARDRDVNDDGEFNEVDYELLKREYERTIENQKE